jgi:hypothetical protein
MLVKLMGYSASRSSDRVHGASTIEDVQDGSIFKDLYIPAMGTAWHNLALSVTWDGISLNADKFSKNARSVWPLSLTILSLPPWIRYMLSSIMLVLVPPLNVSNILRIECFMIKQASA